jgi:hypothetical protein
MEMTTHTPSNIREFASTRETSNVIALAIFELASEGDEIKAVEARAWELADEDEDTLTWGVETVRHPR